MRYVKWLLSICLFLILLGFAVKNDDSVVLKYFFGFEWHVPLVVALLFFFAVGAAFGVLAMTWHVLHLHKEIYSLKKQLKLKSDSEIT